MSSGRCAQRRQRNRQDVQTVEEIFAEASRPHLLLEVPVGGGNDADIDPQIRRAADALERLLLEEPEHLRLQSGCHLADLVQKDRPAVGRLEKAALLSVRAGERAALMTEELAFEQRFGQRGAGDVHERMTRPIARVVDDLGREVLAGAALAHEQHRGRRAHRYFLEQRAHARDRGAHADDPVEAVRLRLARAQGPHLAAQARRLERFLDQHRDFVDVERLVGVVIRAVLHRLDRVVHARVRRQHDDQRVGVVLLDLLQDRQPVGIRQPVVQQDEIDALVAAGERLGGGLRFDNPIALVREAAGQRPANQLLVVHDEDGRGLHEGWLSIRGGRTPPAHRGGGTAGISTGVKAGAERARPGRQSRTAWSAHGRRRERALPPSSRASRRRSS